MLAVASDAIVIGFNVRPDQGAQRLADQDNVQIRRYDIIYRLTEDVEKALHGLLEPDDTGRHRRERRRCGQSSRSGAAAGARAAT